MMQIEVILLAHITIAGRLEPLRIRVALALPRLVRQKSPRLLINRGIRGWNPKGERSFSRSIAGRLERSIILSLRRVDFVVRRVFAKRRRAKRSGCAKRPTAAISRRCISGSSSRRRSGSARIVSSVVTSASRSSGVDARSWLSLPKGRGAPLS